MANHSQTIRVCEQAQTIQANGVAAELAGDFDRAYALFDDALATLDGNTANCSHDYQAAGIERDRAFTSVRHGIAINDATERTGLFERAEAGLDHSLQMLTQVLNPKSPGTFEHTHEDTRAIRASRGATLSCLGRLALVRGTYDNRAQAGSGDEQYHAGYTSFKFAHQALRQGNNGYFLVSNAIIAAKAALLLDLPAEVSRWRRRAIVGLGWTALHDRQNLSRAWDTFRSRERHLAGKPTALASIYTKP